MVAQPGVETFGRCLPRKSGKFCTLFNSQDYLYESEVLPSVDFSDEIFVYASSDQHTQHN